MPYSFTPEEIADSPLTIVKLAAVESVFRNKELTTEEIYEQSKQLFNSPGWTVYDTIRKLNLDITPFLPEGFIHGPGRATE